MKIQSTPLGRITERMLYTWNTHALVLVSLFVSSCAPAEVVTEYEGSLSATVVRADAPRNSFVLIGVPLRVARVEGVMTRLEFSPDCVVRVHAQGAGLAPDARQSCVATVGRTEHLSNGFDRIVSDGLVCEPTTVMFTEITPTRVSAEMHCRSAVFVDGAPSAVDVVVLFIPRPA